MNKLWKGLLGLGLLLLGALLILRLTGLDPEYMDYTTEAYNERGRMTWPGLWLSGELVREPVESWSWVDAVDHPERGNTIMLETRTWYGIPHSVTILPTVRGDKLYIGGSARDSRLADSEFPHYKSYWANIQRDPRVRLKIDGNIYEMTAVLLQPEEMQEELGREPVTTEIAADGTERIVARWYYWRVFQRNINPH